MKYLYKILLHSFSLVITISNVVECARIFIQTSQLPLAESCCEIIISSILNGMPVMKITLYRVVHLTQTAIRCWINQWWNRKFMLFRCHLQCYIIMQNIHWLSCASCTARKWPLTSQTVIFSTWLLTWINRWWRSKSVVFRRLHGDVIMHNVQWTWLSCASCTVRWWSLAVFFTRLLARRRIEIPEKLWTFHAATSKHSNSWRKLAELCYYLNRHRKNYQRYQSAIPRVNHFIGLGYSISLFEWQTFGIADINLTSTLMDNITDHKFQVCPVNLSYTKLGSSNKTRGKTSHTSTADAELSYE